MYTPIDNKKLNLGGSFFVFKGDLNKLSPYAKFQMETYGNILRPSGTRCELENGSQAAEEFTEWMNREAEQQLNEMEN